MMTDNGRYIPKWLRITGTSSDNEEHKGVAVIQYDLKGNYIATFRSVTLASMMSKVNRTAISKVINGQHKTAGDFKWKKIKKEKSNDV